MDFSAKSKFIICVLSRFTNLLFFNFDFPLDIIRIILLNYDFVYHHVDVSGLNRDLLLEKLWRASRRLLHNYLPNLWSLTNAKNYYLKKSPNSDKETFFEDIANVPIHVDIYQEGNIMNVKSYNEFTGENTFQKIVSLYRKMLDKSSKLEHSTKAFTLAMHEECIKKRLIKSKTRVYINYQKNYEPINNEQFKKVRHIDAEGLYITGTAFETEVKITHSYSFEFKEGQKYPVSNNKIRIIL